MFRTGQTTLLYSFRSQIPSNYNEHEQWGEGGGGGDPLRGDTSSVRHLGSVTNWLLPGPEPERVLKTQRKTQRNGWRRRGMKTHLIMMTSLISPDKVKGHGDYTSKDGDQPTNWPFDPQAQFAARCLFSVGWPDVKIWTKRPRRSSWNVFVYVCSAPHRTEHRCSAAMCLYLGGVLLRMQKQCTGLLRLPINRLLKQGSDVSAQKWVVLRIQKHFFGLKWLRLCIWTSERRVKQACDIFLERALTL